METKATVIALDGDYALVEADRKSACDGCHKQQDGHGCAMCAMMGDKTAMRSRARNPLGAVPGDEVLLETPSARVLGYAALVFLLPLAAAMLFSLLGALCFGALGRGIAAACGFVLAFVFLWLYSRRVIARRCDVTITCILHHD